MDAETKCYKGLASSRRHLHKLSYLVVMLFLVTISCSAGAQQTPAEYGAENLVTATAAPSAPESIPEPTSVDIIRLATPTEGGPAPQDTNPAPTPPLATASTALPEIPEARRLVLEWTSKIKVGDPGIVSITLEMDEGGKITPTASVGGDQIVVEPVLIPNLYATHDVIAQARLDIAGLEYRPEGEISEALLPGQPVKFIWSVRPGEVGKYQGTVWLHLLFVPRSGGEEMRKVISAQIIDIQAVNFLGLSGNSARIVGGVGTAVGSVFGLDNLLSWVWKILQGRIKRAKAGS
jgi:hypothetical protein